MGSQWTSAIKENQTSAENCKAIPILIQQKNKKSFCLLNIAIKNSSSTAVKPVAMFDTHLHFGGPGWFLHSRLAIETLFLAK